jgi:hypothetical protein
MIEYKGHAILAESIMIGKLGADSKGQISEENCFENRTIQLCKCFRDSLL